MRLATVDHGGEERVVVGLPGDRLIGVDTLLALAHFAGPAPRDMLDVIAGGEPLRDALAQATAGLDVGTAAALSLPADEVRWRPPVPRPGKICCVAMNNSASNARKISAPEHPAFFLKPPSCLVGHREPVHIRAYYGSVHPEPELAAVIGAVARDAAPERALETVYGFSIFDDITGNGMRAEDLFHYWAIYARPDDPDATQRVEQHLSYAARYKGTDGFGVLGPWLVTRDEIGDPDDLAVECRVGGETVAQDSTRYYNYRVAEVISFLSYFQTLEPGDVISFGTAFKPSAGRRSIHHANLQTVPGPIEIRIDGLGEQSSPVVVEQRELGRWRLA